MGGGRSYRAVFAELCLEGASGQFGSVANETDGNKVVFRATQNLKQGWPNRLRSYTGLFHTYCEAPGKMFIYLFDLLGNFYVSSYCCVLLLGGQWLIQ